jgi:cytochrome c biogenesis protein CcdA
MTDYSLALAAGMLAAVNPCGFALLPAYLSLLLLSDGGPGARTAAWQLAARRLAALRALLLTAAMTLGFVGLFGLVGFALEPAADALRAQLPWCGVVFGLVLLAMGGWLLTGRALPAPGARLRTGPTLTRSVPSMVVFGAAYALSSLGCTIGPFLAVVVSSARAGATSQSAALFVAYAGGMGAIVGVVALAVALVRTAAVVRMRRFAASSARLSGVLLVASGGYVAWYGWYEVRLLRGQLPQDPVIALGEALQFRTAYTVDRIGVPAMAVLLVSLLIGVLLAAAGRRRPAGRTGRGRP